jgi:hypothetical protein
MNSQYIEFCRNTFIITDIDAYTQGYKFQKASAIAAYDYFMTDSDWEIEFCDQYFGFLKGKRDSYYQGMIDAYLDGKSIERPIHIPSEIEFSLNQNITNLCV